MKFYSIFYLALMLGHQTVSQTFREELLNKHPWKAYQVVIAKESKDSLIQLTDFWDRVIEIKYDSSKALARHRDDFTVLDLNLDGKLDLIYSGSTLGAEGKSFDIYLNNGFKLETVYSGNGIATRFEMTFPKSPLKITIERSGCCDDPLNEIIDVIGSWKDDKVHFIESASVYWYSLTHIPSDKNLNINFQVINQLYMLRASPEIINSRKNDFDHYFTKGNIIAEFKKGDIGTAMASKKDSTGREWWYVIMENNMDKDFNADYYHVHPNDENKGRWLGWMSSRYLKQLDN